MTSTRSLAVLAVVATLGLVALYLASPGCFGCGGLVFDGAPPAGVKHDVEAAVVSLTIAVSLVAISLTGFRLLRRRRSA